MSSLLLSLWWLLCLKAFLFVCVFVCMCVVAPVDVAFHWCIQKSVICCDSQDFYYVCLPPFLCENCLIFSLNHLKFPQTMLAVISIMWISYARFIFSNAYWNTYVRYSLTYYLKSSLNICENWARILLENGKV